MNDGRVGNADRTDTVSELQAIAAEPDFFGEVAKIVPLVIEPGLIEDTVQDDPAFAVEYAYIAQNRGDWPEAVRRWQWVRKRFPDQLVAYTEGAVCLDKARRYQELEALYGETSERFPDIDRPTVEFAWMAHHRRDWPTVLERWKRVHERFPRHLTGYLGCAYTFMQAGRPDEADALLASGLAGDPNHPELLIAYARQAQQQRNWPEALRRFATVAARVPERVTGFVGRAEAMSELGRFDEAEELLRGTMTAFPSEPVAFAEYARVASRREAPVEAVRRWEETVRRFPDDVALTSELFSARLRLLEVDRSTVTETNRGEPLGDPDTSLKDPGSVDLAPRELVMKFESLGGSGHGCEFGIFQRNFGAEPFGLLRWVDIGPDQLAAALETEFDGVGQPEHTELFVPPSPEPEYWTRDLRHWMVMRTFVLVKQVPEETMRDRACVRLQVLRRKLIDDLRAASKIFVYKSLRRNLTDKEVARIHRALRHFGENTLLYIRYEEAEHPNGTVEIAAPGLMIGYIDHFAVSPEEVDLGPAHESLLAICKRAYRLWAEPEAQNGRLGWSE